MTAIAAQIPFELFEPEAPSLDNYLMGENEEAVALLRGIASGQSPHQAVTLWGGPATGKTHLLSAAVSTAQRAGRNSLFLSSHSQPAVDPFTDLDLLAADDVQSLDETGQTWLFTAFNHVIARGGIVLAAADAPPMQLSAVRDDLRTRLGSGVVTEIRAVPQDALAPLLLDHALQRGVGISEEVLTYILSHSQRDVSHLCQLIGGIDRYSLSLKRPITVPLVRGYFAQQMSLRR
ncbi:MAG: hypothetical protein EAZ30_08530 [Betaproteobacteria bacterium]|nr:MAG: hypothetical protein EAZ30_08530 [Betaproteobacteria bacterium]